MFDYLALCKLAQPACSCRLHLGALNAATDCCNSAVLHATWKLCCISACPHSPFLHPAAAPSRFLVCLTQAGEGLALDLAARPSPLLSLGMFPLPPALKPGLQQQSSGSP